MTLRSTLVAIAVLAAPPALAATVPAQPNGESTTSATPPRTAQTPRKIERPRAGTPLTPRVIEAPGAAVMMIPATYDPTLPGPFSRF